MDPKWPWCVGAIDSIHLSDDLPLTATMAGGKLEGGASMQKWETLKEAAVRTHYQPHTFENWKTIGKLPFPIYVNNLVKPEEVDAWVESTQKKPQGHKIEKTTVDTITRQPSVEKYSIERYA